MIKEKFIIIINMNLVIGVIKMKIYVDVDVCFVKDVIIFEVMNVEIFVIFVISFFYYFNVE